MTTGSPPGSNPGGRKEDIAAPGKVMTELSPKERLKGVKFTVGLIKNNDYEYGHMDASDDEIVVDENEFDDDENFFSVLDEHRFIFEGKISFLTSFL